jgi:hypothetical protein
MNLNQIEFIFFVDGATIVVRWCHGNGVPIYSWDEDAPDLTLGNETGILTGNGAGFKKLFVQVCPHLSSIVQTMRPMA